MAANTNEKRPQVVLSVNQCHLLDGKKENFSSWKQLMIAQLKQNELWNGIVFRPTSPSAEKDGAAQALIRTMMMPSEAAKLGVCETAGELWAKIQENYEGSQDNIKRNAGRIFMSFKAKKNESVAQLCGRFESMLAKIEATGHKIGDGEKIYQLQRSTPTKIRNWIDYWSIANKNGKLPELIRDLKSRFEIDDDEEVKEEEREESALYAANKRSSKGQNFFKNNKFEKPKSNKGRSNNDKTNVDRHNIVCSHCNKKGHTWRNCNDLINKYKKSEFQNESTTSTHNIGLMAIEDDNGEIGVQDNIWIADSGASAHMTGKRELLVNFETFKDPKIILTAGSRQLAIGQGTYEFKHNGTDGHLSNVLLVTGLKVNIVSLRKVLEHKYNIFMDSKTNTIDVYEGKKVIMQAFTLPNSLMGFHLAKKDEDSLYIGTTLDEWHRRFGHSSQVEAIHKHNMVTGLEVTERGQKNCLECLGSKICKVHHPVRSNISASEDNAVMHFDTCGPMSTESLGQCKYFVIGVDEWSNYRFIRFIRLKSGIADEVKTMITQAELESKRMVKKIVTDGGTEYSNNNLSTWLKGKGIIHEISVPYTPQQNGVAERAIRSIVESSRAILMESNLPLEFWAEACNTATYVLNRTPSPRNPEKTRYELFTGVKPNVNHLRVFGQFAITLDRGTETRSKFEPKSHLVKMIGYGERKNTYRVYDPKTRKITTRCDIKFLPLDFKPNNVETSSVNSDQPMVVINSSTISQDNTLDLTDDTNNNPVARNDRDLRRLSEDFSNLSLNDDDHVNQPIDITNNSPVNTVGTVASTNNQDVNADSSNQDQSVNNEAGSTTFSIDELVDVGATSKVTERSNARNRARARNESFFVPFDNKDRLLFSVEEDPKNFDEAIKGPNSDEWINAINSELTSLKNNNTWEEIPRPNGIKTVGSKWILRTKLMPDGSTKRKARLVATGFTQQYGIDFNSTYAPVAMLTSIRLVLAIATVTKMILRQFDVRTAFLYGDLEENLFLETPKGVDISSGMVLKLKKSLYGLKQSPRCWNKKFNDILTKFNLIQSSQDPCLYYNSDRTIILCIYVDDGLLAVKSVELAEKLIEHMKKFIELSEGEFTTFLGMEVYRDENESIILHQRRYIKSILERFGMNNCNGASTPEAAGAIDFDSYPPAHQDFPFREIVGSLLYLSTCTRPDISHAVNLASRTAKPTEAHVALLKRILRYISCTDNWGIRFKGEKSSGLVAYSDADYANEMSTRKSTTGYYISFSGCPIIYRTQKQPIVALSSTEAEFIALVETVKELIPIKRILEELGFKLDAIPVRVDNQSSIKIAENGVGRQRTKHIDVRAKWITNEIEKKTIALSHITGNENPADIFTKPLQKQQFEKNRSLIMSTFLMLTMLSVFISCGEASLSKTSPVYYSESEKLVVNGMTTYDVGVFIPNPCEIYFKNSTVNWSITDDLQKICNSWFNELSNDINQCQIKITNIELKIENHNNEIGLLRDKRFIPLIWIAIIIITAEASYIVHNAEQNSKNAHLLKDAINDNKRIMDQAIQGMEAVRDSIHELNEKLDEMEEKIISLNKTVHQYPKSYALLAHVFHFVESTRPLLQDINRSVRKGKISNSLKTLTNQDFWIEPAEKYSKLLSCERRMDKTGLEISLKFTVPKIDDTTQILEATGFKIWNLTTPNSGCRLKYSGPRYVLANRTTNCFMGIDSAWFDGELLEAHPCDTSDSASLKGREPTYTKERCGEYKSSPNDIQIKRFNGFHRIYCKGNQILIKGLNQTCPDYVFQIPLTEPFVVNNYSYEVSSAKREISVNADLLEINNFISKELSIDKVEINTKSLIKLDDKLNKLNEMFKKVGANITLVESDFGSLGDFLSSPWKALTSLWSSVKYYLTGSFAIIGLVLATLLGSLLIKVGEIAYIAFRTWWRLTRSSARSIIRTLSTNHAANAVQTKKSDYLV